MTSPKTTTAPVGVCVWDIPRYAHYMVSYPQYVHEILGHAGLCYESVAPADLLARLPHLRLLLTIGECEPPAALREQLAAWVERGGAWLSVGGVCGLASLFGVQVEPAAYRLYGFASNLGEGYLRTDTVQHPILGHITLPLHYFNGISVLPAGGQVLASVLNAHQRPTPRAALVENSAGRGRVFVVEHGVAGLSGPDQSRRIPAARDSTRDHLARISGRAGGTI